MKNAFLFTFFLWTFVAHAQDRFDQIYLKNGIFYKGNVAEYIPDDHAVIVLLDGRTLTIPADSIAGLLVGKDELIKKHYDIKSRGYFHYSLIGPQMGRSESGGIEPYLSFNTINGYKINGHHMGVGLGLENHVGKFYAPIYADYTYHFFKKDFRPMVGVNGGFLIPIDDIRYADSYKYDYQKGQFLGFRFGFAAYGNEHFAFLLNITYKYTELDGAEYSSINFLGRNPAYQGSAALHRVGLMVGFLIN